MAIIKCKMCGGDLELMEGASTARCEFCGSVQTIPNLDDEKKLIQFERAERLRKQCEFDKAAGIYETIVADFRQEAEAYWGLVLCKYGIEYVDDPATGKKIPTCHRSSFDSIMEDSDFEQAMENADGAARKVYRDEAKVIEEIRKGIIAVSSNEQPYDIFICYKETAENGDRTLDSVLAQDVYDALTDKGYRVFFSRISLEDKLGVEYEPYIFAALNSAKIMLAFGTDYEYFNAVWVKNEWSRFLKLMAKDKDKHLIPCYKGIDAYDMPKEFAKLQAQDMGKVGAMQDLLRGIEKILPRQTAQPAVIQERVVVGGGGDNKIASLLDRGNMALEDGDWAKADSFFEDVLNNDSKNAQAYLGKTLAQEKCRTMDAFVRKRKDAYPQFRNEKLTLQPNLSHIEEKVQEFSIPGYAEPEVIRSLYTYDLSYYSDAPRCRKQYQDEKAYWSNHKTLSKAEKFATGAVAENLQREKKTLFAAFTDRIKKAEEAEASAKKALLQCYQEHLQACDKKAEQLHLQGRSLLEKDYQFLLQTAKNSNDVDALTKTAAKFRQLGDYQDSKNLAEHCRKRAAEEQAKLDEEAQRQQLIRFRQEKERKAKAKRNMILAACLAGVVLLAGVFVYLLNSVIIPGNTYNKALEQMETGNYEAAIELFRETDGYKDSESKILQCQTGILERSYQQALALMEDGKYQQAYDLFVTIPEHSDAAVQAKEAMYRLGLEHWEAEEYEVSNEIFTALGDYKDSAGHIHTHTYETNVEQAAECEKAGIMRFNCTDCTHTYTEAIPATGHDYSNAEIIVSPSCTTEGEQKVSCHCGASFTEPIEKTAHTYKDKITTAAGCEKQGVRTYTCTVCGDSYTEKINPKGHVYDKGTISKQPSCESAGVKTFACTDCDASYTETLTALGHDYGKATCTKGGKCSRCSATTKPLGHTTTTETCDRCNYNFTQKTTISGGSSTISSLHYDVKLSRGRYSITFVVENGGRTYKKAGFELCYYSTLPFERNDLYALEEKLQVGTYSGTFELTETVTELTVYCTTVDAKWTMIIEPINDSNG